jgi:AraC-like DNA-binding protein
MQNALALNRAKMPGDPVESVAVSMLKLLWVDMTVAGGEPALPPGVAEYFEVTHASGRQSLERRLKSARPDAVFFEFDYPDKGSLSVAAKLKQANPSIPMVFVTLQHSEALAVWVFRSRFADYLVRPLRQAESDRCLAMLEEMLAEKRVQTGRRMPQAPVAMPAEVPAAVMGARSLLPAVHYIEGHLAEKIAGEEMAQLCSMSPFRFSREFKEAFGMSFREYLVRLRLKEAARLLENPQARVTQVAYAVGFNDMSYFSRMFKRYFGVSPSSVQGVPRQALPAGGVQPGELPALSMPSLPSSSAILHQT